MVGKTKAPTKLERQWMDAITDLGCIVCLEKHSAYRPAVVHHIVEGNRRLGHLYSIPLCEPGHHQNGKGPFVSRHPNKYRFELTYGDEWYLWHRTRTHVERRCGLELEEADL